MGAGAFLFHTLEGRFFKKIGKVGNGRMIDVKRILQSLPGVCLKGVLQRCVDHNFDLEQ